MTFVSKIEFNLLKRLLHFQCAFPASLLPSTAKSQTRTERVGEGGRCFFRTEIHSTVQKFLAKYSTFNKSHFGRTEAEGQEGTFGYYGLLLRTVPLLYSSLLYRAQEHGLVESSWGPLHSQMLTSGKTRAGKHLSNPIFGMFPSPRYSGPGPLMPCGSPPAQLCYRH